ncbi:hypothetical protein ACWGH8_19785 [Nonomuraea muscovyensis]
MSRSFTDAGMCVTQGFAVLFIKGIGVEFVGREQIGAAVERLQRAVNVGASWRPR